MTGENLSPLAARLADAIAASRTVRVNLAVLREAAYNADLGLAGNPEARRTLSRLIDSLDAAHIIRLPGPAHWDRSAQPHLPNWVSRINHTTPRPRPRPERPVVAWHARLSWAAAFIAREHPTPAEMSLLEAANRYLAETSPRTTIAARERSLQLLHDEKALDTLSRGRLFEPGRLTLTDLRCVRLPLPVPTWSIGEGPATLLVENHTTAHTIAHWLHAGGAVGTVIWSGGNQLPQILQSMPDTHGRPLSYFGDLDHRGIEIAADGNQVAHELGLGPLHPAGGLYRLLLQVGAPIPSKTRTPAKSPSPALAWLPLDLRDQVAETLISGHRIAQEAVNAEILAALSPTEYDPLA